MRPGFNCRVLQIPRFLGIADSGETVESRPHFPAAGLEAKIPRAPVDL